MYSTPLPTIAEEGVYTNVMDSIVDVLGVSSWGPGIPHDLSINTRPTIVVPHIPRRVLKLQCENTRPTIVVPHIPRRVLKLQCENTLVAHKRKIATVDHEFERLAVESERLGAIEKREIKRLIPKAKRLSLRSSCDPKIPHDLFFNTCPTIVAPHNYCRLRVLKLQCKTTLVAHKRKIATVDNEFERLAGEYERLGSIEEREINRTMTKAM